MQGCRQDMTIVSLKYCIRTARALTISFAQSRCLVTQPSIQRLFIWAVEVRKPGFQQVCASWVNPQVCNGTYIHQHVQSKEESHQTHMWLLSASTQRIDRQDRLPCADQGPYSLWGLSSRKNRPFYLGKKLSELSFLEPKSPLSNLFGIGWQGQRLLSKAGRWRVKKFRESTTA